MDIKQIEEKIAEYECKLQRKKDYVARKGSKNVIKSRSIPKHLVKYYREEIAKLEKERKNYISQKSYSYSILWEQVFFEQNHIKVKFNNQYSLPWYFYPSRASFEYIKPYLNRLNLPTLKVILRGREILSIDNLEYFSQAVEMLSFKNNIDQFLKERQPHSITTIINGLEKLSNKVIKELLSLNNKGQYLSHLCDIQSADYRIIPTPELFIFGNSLKEEDTFIFTIVTEEKLLLIWESVNFARATYIFQADEESYRDKLYTIFGYIISPEKYKRSSLRELIPQTDTIHVIQHDDFEDWKNKIGIM